MSGQLTTIAALVALVGIGWWQLRRLRTLDGAEPTGARPAVSVVIPARNEASTLPRLLASLAAQTRPADQIVVVDDGSDDDTRALATATGATVLAAAPRPVGWIGKPWACMQGAEAAAGDVLVFLDADVQLAPDALARLLATYDQQEGGMLSVQPMHETVRWWEQLSALPNVVAVLATGALRRGGPEPAVAFGPCLVTDRASYERAGTHEAVAGEIIEDLALARAYADADLPVRCAYDDDLVSYRMYPDGLRQLVEGWTKNLAGGPAYVPPASLVASTLWLLGLSSIVGTVTSGAVRGELTVAGPLWLVTSIVLHWTLGRIGSFRWWAAPAFPLLFAAFVTLFVRSAIYRMLGRVTWRGRAVSGAGT